MKKTRGCLIVFLILLLSWQTAFARTDTATAKDCFQKGVAYENQAVYGEAINLFSAAIDLDPSYTDAYLHRGMSYRFYEISATTEAVEDFSRAILLDPKNAEAYYQRGLVNEFIINNEAAKSDMIAAAGLGHEEAQRWLALLNKQDEPVAAPAPVAAEPLPVPKCKPAADQGFDLAEYLPGGMQPIVYFDFNKSTIRSEGFAVLDEIAGVLEKKLPEAVVLVVGHTDSTGTEKYNAGLSLRRAETVKAYLTEKRNIAADRISAGGYGEMAPADTNETEEGRARNRRASVAGIRK